MCIEITCFPVCDVINIDINLSFPVKLLFSMTKKSGQKFNLRTKRAFNVKQQENSK